MNTTTFKVNGMQCDGCADRIRTLLCKEPGVREARVSFAEGSAKVRHNPHTVDEMQLREIIEMGGFDVVETMA